jgi:hypothetical protein
MTGFASFECGLPEAPCSIKLEGEAASRPRPLLKAARDCCWHAQFAYAPVDRKAIQREAGGAVKNFDEMLGELESVKPRSLKSSLAQFVEEPKGYSGKGDFRDFAVAHYLYCRFSPAFDIRVPNDECAYGGARLAANIEGWRVVKRANAGEKEETLAGLVGIFHSSARKLAELNGAGGEELVKKHFKRKSFSSLKPFLEEVSGLEKEKRECLALKGFEAAGAAPFISIETVNKCYPKFKIPKPRGRLPKA